MACVHPIPYLIAFVIGFIMARISCDFGQNTRGQDRSISVIISTSSFLCEDPAKQAAMVEVNELLAVRAGAGIGVGVEVGLER